ncbi:ATP-dependent DNA helicase RecG [hydrothermal vent metagenome]|uniref:ATP-dependent DNA helicase RecG n=1 Tax=hydrothermal vent metagenome TaxID=652676 RepID=A0A1W1CAW5_9ZZZZ
MQEAKALMAKLKIYTLLDLALLVPSSYGDTTLSNEIEIGRVNTLESVVREVRNYNGKLIVTFYLTKFDKSIQSMFFRVTPYHYQTFTNGSRHIIQGKVELYRDTLQMNQPKSIKRAGEITPKYKTVLKNLEMRSLIERYLNDKALIAEGLLPREADILMELHFPRDLHRIYKSGTQYSDEVLSSLKFIEAFNHIKKLSSKKVDYPPMRRVSGNISPFIERLPFDLTDEQKIVISDIKSDLNREDRAARRLVVGDVGSGKTMVILASVMMALPHKSILMAPTSLLAQQLYEEATKYLPSTVDIALVMQGRSEGNYREAHFIIGTHAILYKDDLPKAPLVMVDEQHRFGTNQRQLLESISSDTVDGIEYKSHYIQFSATPIPRTQAMMESALIDVSLITKRPFQKSITTSLIGKNDFPKLLYHIKDEISKGHQVLIVYPLVEESETIEYQSLAESRGFWEDRFDNVYVTHGKDKAKDQVLLEFKERGDILLATTVVEVGISLPRLTIIVIVGAERLGLATLHQLRGRVGRLGLESWCYLFSKNKKSPRLEAFATTDSGFDIAKLDLKFRDSGDILDGTMQSGQKFKWLDMSEDENIVSSAKSRVDMMK